MSFKNDVTLLGGGMRKLWHLLFENNKSIVFLRDKGGGGQHLPNFAWRHFWTAPVRLYGHLKHFKDDTGYNMLLVLPIAIPTRGRWWNLVQSLRSYGWKRKPCGNRFLLRFWYFVIPLFQIISEGKHPEIYLRAFLRSSLILMTWLLKSGFHKSIIIFHNRWILNDITIFCVRII